MDRRTFTKATVAGAAATWLSPAFAAAGPPASPPLRTRSVVLVHGAYADGSSWSSVIPLLQDRGLDVAAVQNPLTSFDDDCAVTRRTLALMEGPVVLAARYPTPPASAGLVRSPDGFAQLSRAAFLTDFAQDVDARQANALYAVQGRISDQLFSATTTAAAWRDKPTFYAVSRNDRTIDPDLERFMATRMNATTVELDASHLSIVSRPREAADLILHAAAI